MRRTAVGISLALLLSGCSSDKALDPKIGQVYGRHHQDDYDDCNYEDDLFTDEYDPRMVCTHHDDVYELKIHWKAQRFQNDEGKVYTQDAYSESDYEVDEDTYIECRDGDWYQETDGSWGSNSGFCDESYETILSKAS